jgi:hypothetical protein
VDLEGISRAIRHVWGFLVPPFINLVILSALIALGIGTNTNDAATRTPASVASGTPPAPLQNRAPTAAPPAQSTPSQTVAPGEPQTNLSTAGNDSPTAICARLKLPTDSAPQNPSTTDQQNTTEHICVATVTLLQALHINLDFSKEAARIVNASLNVVKALATAIVSVIGLGFTALLYMSLFILVIMLLLDMLTKAIGFFTNFLGRLCNLYRHLKNLYQRLATYIATEYERPAFLTFVVDAIPNSEATAFIRAKLASDGVNDSLSNYELFQISLAWLSKNAQQTEWQVDREGRVEELVITERVLLYIKSYVAIVVGLYFMLYIEHGRYWWPVIILLFLLIAWGLVGFSHVVARRRLMQYDVEAYRFYNLAGSVKASVPTGHPEGAQDPGLFNALYM